MNPDLDRLHPYPFEKLTKLKSGISIPKDLTSISLGIGEPKHPSPEFVKQVIADNLDKLANYPTTKGTDELRQAIAHWATRRFELTPGSLTPEHHIVPVNGTREGIFSLVQSVVESSPSATVVSPNPFYQVYEGAAFLAGATPHYLACDADSDFIPDFDKVSESVWKDCKVLFLCSPGNPSGSVIPRETSNCATTGEILAVPASAEIRAASCSLMLHRLLMSSWTARAEETNGDLVHGSCTRDNGKR